MSEDDEALIAKAMLLGCTFEARTSKQTGTTRYYRDIHSDRHPFDEGHLAGTKFYGWEDPVELARAWIKYCEDHHHDEGR